MVESPRDAYRVVQSEILRQRLAGWMARAATLGVRQWFRDLLQVIQDQLSSNPVQWGDPLYRLKNLDLLVCRRIYERIIVEYAVHQEERVVFLKDLRLQPENPLADRP
jgi:hypothetical protein